MARLLNTTPCSAGSSTWWTSWSEVWQRRSMPPRLTKLSHTWLIHSQRQSARPTNSIAQGQISSIPTLLLAMTFWPKPHDLARVMSWVGIHCCVERFMSIWCSIDPMSTVRTSDPGVVDTVLMIWVTARLCYKDTLMIRGFHLGMAQIKICG